MGTDENSPLSFLRNVCISFKELVQGDIKSNLRQDICLFCGGEELLTSLSYPVFCLQVPNKLLNESHGSAEDEKGFVSWKHRHK